MAKPKLHFGHWLPRRLPGKIHAITLGRHIYFAARAQDVPAETLVHELVHHEQYTESRGLLTYLLAYVLFWLLQLVKTRSIRRAYREHPAEVEAYGNQADPRRARAALDLLGGDLPEPLRRKVEAQAARQA